MRLIEEEHELRPLGIADLRHDLEQLRQEPQQERGVEPRALHQAISGQDVDIARTRGVAADHVLEIERRLAEEPLAALLLQRQQGALDRADALLADIAVLGGERSGVLGRPLQHGLQVLEVEQQQALLVGELEDDVQNAFLGVVELQQTGHQHRTDLGHGRAHRVAFVAEQVPVDRRKGAAGIAVNLELLGAIDCVGIVSPRLADARQISLHVGHEHRHTVRGEAFGNGLQRHRLAGAGGAGDQAMAIGVFQEEKLVGVACAHKDRRVVAHAASFGRTIDFSQRRGAIVG